MAIINAENWTAGQIMARVSGALVNHRQAMEVLNSIYAWTSGITAADLEAAPPNGPGLSVVDANAVLTAVADAHAEYLIHVTGQAPSSYPQVSSPYVYAASQNALIGPG